MLWKTKLKIAGAFFLLEVLGTATTVGAQTIDRSAEIEFKGGYSEFDLKTGISRFENGFSLKQRGFELTAETAEVYHEPTTQSLLKVVAQGEAVQMVDVLEDGQTIRAAAQFMDFEFEKQSVTMKGKVVVNDPRGQLSGEFLVYDMKNKVLRAGDRENRQPARFTIPAKE